MINTAAEYEKVQHELDDLEAWLKRLEREHPLSEMGLSKAGIRKMIARLHKELGEHESTPEVETSRV